MGHKEWIYICVENGEKINLGKYSLIFYETRMLHWPESMVCHAKEAGILFSQDAFGMHLASSERFDDEISTAILEEEAAKYFARVAPRPLSGPTPSMTAAQSLFITLLVPLLLLLELQLIALISHHKYNHRLECL